MKFNNKQRAEIYLKAAENIDSSVATFCCLELKRLTSYTVIAFPEFSLFKPKLLPIKGCSAWWIYKHGIDRQERILALLFSHQIALNP